jgi:TrmH RNA methyltransferase
VEALIPRLQPVLKWCVANRVGYRVVEEGDLNKLAGTTHHEGVVADVLRAPSCRWRSGWSRSATARRWRCGWMVWATRTTSARSCARPRTSASRRCCCRPAARWRCPVPPRAWPKAVPKSVPLVQLPETAQAMAQLRAAGFGLAATLVEGGDDVFRTSLPARLVYVMGAEGEGMDRSLAGVRPAGLDSRQRRGGEPERGLGHGGAAGAVGEPPRRLSR